MAELVDRWVAGRRVGRPRSLSATSTSPPVDRSRTPTVPFQLLTGVADPLTRRGFDRLDPVALAATSERVVDVLDGLRRSARDRRAAEAISLGESWRGRARPFVSAATSGARGSSTGDRDRSRSYPPRERRALAARLDDLIAGPPRAVARAQSSRRARRCARLSAARARELTQGVKLAPRACSPPARRAARPRRRRRRARRSRPACACSAAECRSRRPRLRRA